MLYFFARQVGLKDCDISYCPKALSYCSSGLIIAYLGIPEVRQTDLLIGY